MTQPYQGGYYNPYMPDWQLPQVQPLPLIEQPQQQQGMNPMQGFNMYQQFSGGASGGAEGAAGMDGSWLSSFGPWVALAAAIAVNEDQAMKGGYRDQDSRGYAQDLLGGKVFEQDAQQRWAPQLDKMDSKLGTNTGDTMRMVGDLATFDFSNAGKSFEDSLKKDPLIKGILSLF